jgi:outer membrane protein OmpA-like peptidoglycan-associated protein
MNPFRNSLLAAALGATLAACTPPYMAPPVLGGQNAQTAALENSDRVSRFNRLAALNGVTPPTVEQLTAMPGQAPGLTQPVPVVRVVFDERDVFASGSDVVQPQAGPMLDLVADSMRRDVPDAQLTLLGHTDATGPQALNADLSARRARSVFQALVNRGVNAGQLNTVAIGSSQPIAPNDTAAGRARNRRVEFMVSADLGANLAVVGQRAPNPGYLALGPGQRRVRQASAKVAIMRTAVYDGPSDVSEAEPHGRVKLQALGSLELQENKPVQIDMPANRAI